MQLLLKFWRETLIVILSGTCYVLWSAPPEVVVREVAASNEAVEKVQKVSIVVVEPDGTKTEKTVETVKNNKKETKVLSETSDKVDVRAAQYSVSLLRGMDGRYGAVVGVRLGELPLWGEAGYIHDSVLLGVRYEF